METPDKQTISRLVDESFIFKSLEGWVRGKLKEFAVPRFFESGQVLMREDEEGMEMMILVSGLVEVTQLGGGGDVALATLKPGAVIGEVAVITGTSRTSTVTALEDSIALAFSAEVIGDLIDLNPKIKKLLLKLIEGRARQSLSKMV